MKLCYLTERSLFRALRSCQHAGISLRRTLDVRLRFENFSQDLLRTSHAYRLDCLLITSLSMGNYVS